MKQPTSTAQPFALFLESTSTADKLVWQLITSIFTRKSTNNSRKFSWKKSRKPSIIKITSTLETMEKSTILTIWKDWKRCWKRNMVVQFYMEERSSKTSCISRRPLWNNQRKIVSWWGRKYLDPLCPSSPLVVWNRSFNKSEHVLNLWLFTASAKTRATLTSSRPIPTQEPLWSTMSSFTC